MSVLHAFCCHLNLILIHFYCFITGVCSEIPCSIFSRFAETIYLNSISFQLTGCHMMRDLVWGISEQTTNSFISFLFCLLVLYFYIAFSRVFFQYVSYKLFRWYLLNLIGLLTYMYSNIYVYIYIYVYI